MSKKLLSCMLAIAMVSTLATATTTASAVDTQTRGTIYFDSTNLYGATSNGSKAVYCYAWSNTDGALYSWTSKYTKMTNIGEHLYSYDVPSVNYNGEPVDANLMIFSANGGAQSWEVTFSDDCIGDTAYIYKTIYESGPHDSNMGTPLCKWINTRTEGPHLVISPTTGEVMGYTLLENETIESVVDEFIENYQFGMDSEFPGYDNPYWVTDEAKEALLIKVEEIVNGHIDPTEPPTEPPIEDDVITDDSTIVFNIPDSWVLCHGAYDIHLWNISPNSENPYNWESRTDRMTLDEYTRNLAWYTLPEGDWNMMFVSSIGGEQTLNSVIGPEFGGHYFTVKENNYGIESINDLYEVVWDSKPAYYLENYCSTHREIVLGSSIGVIGNAFVPGETDATIFNDFRNEYGRKADGSCLWDETKKDMYNMTWEEAERYIAKLLSVEYLLDGFSYTEEYGLKKGLPVVEGMEIPKRYSTDFVGADKVPVDWDGYYDVYYFEAPESWLTENTDKKLDGYEIGVYWEGLSNTFEEIYNKKDVGVPAKKLSKLDENGNDIYADSNIYYAFVPTFACKIIWNNAIDRSIENYYNYSSEVSDYYLGVYGLEYNNIALNHSEEFDGVNMAGCLMYRPDYTPDETLEPNYDHVSGEYKFFDPQTGETTTVPLMNEYGNFVTKSYTRVDSYAYMTFEYPRVAMNPYYDMDYAYTYANSVDGPVDGPTDNPDGPTDNPVDKPTEKPTTAPTQAPTNAPSSNNSNGTVNTAQSSTVAVLALTLLASFGVAFAISKKRAKNN